jgi:hypothetical protein
LSMRYAGDLAYFFNDSGEHGTPLGRILDC